MTQAMATTPSASGASMLERLTTISLAAGKVILEIYDRKFEVVHKADSSPLTEADIAAEALILEALGAAYPDIPVVAEEAVANGSAPECGARFFLVDPLDGSKEFIKRNGEFTVNIALVENGAPKLGVVYAPALKRIWWGGAGEGSFAAMVENGEVAEPAAIAVRLAPAKGLTLVGSRSHGSGEGDGRLDALVIDDFTSLGSSLKFCLVAEGRADLYPRFGRTMEWDTAAGDAVLRAAGGLVVDESASPLVYGKCDQAHDSDFANPHFWALGDNALLDHVKTLAGGDAR